MARRNNYVHDDHGTALSHRCIRIYKFEPSSLEGVARERTNRTVINGGLSSRVKIRLIISIQAGPSLSRFAVIINIVTGSYTLTSQLFGKAAIDCLYHIFSCDLRGA